MTGPREVAVSGPADENCQEPLTDHHDAESADAPPHVFAVLALRDLASGLNVEQSALELLPVLRAMETLVGAALDRTVQAARADTATWQAVGEAVGMSRQSAWQRWKPTAPDGEQDASQGEPQDSNHATGSTAPGAAAPRARRHRQRDDQPWAEDVTVRLVRLPLPGLRVHLTHTPAAPGRGGRVPSAGGDAVG